MFTVDKYLAKKFSIGNYNCWHFVRDVWFELTGHMLYDYTPAKTNKHELELAAIDATHHFVETDLQSADKLLPLIVLFRRPKDAPHIGVLYLGKVLHMRPQGVRWEPLQIARMSFDRVNFYTTR